MQSISSVTFYMNCHSRALETSLRAYLAFQDTKFDHIVTYVHINQTKSLSDEEKYDYCAKANILEKISNCDLFVCNPVSSEHGFWSVDNILQFRRKEKKTLRLPYSRFGGYWNGYSTPKHSDPDLFRIGLPQHLIDEYLKQHEAEKSEIHNLFLTMESNGTLDVHEKTRKKTEEALHRFENLCAEKSDLDLFPFVRDQYKHQQLFYNGDHPTPVFFDELARQVVNRFSIDERKCADIPETHFLNTYEQPILRATRAALSLDFDYDESICWHGIRLTHREYITLYILCNYNDRYIEETNIKKLLSEILDKK